VLSKWLHFQLNTKESDASINSFYRLLQVCRKWTSHRASLRTDLIFTRICHLNQTILNLKLIHTGVSRIVWIVEFRIDWYGYGSLRSKHSIKLNLNCRLKHLIGACWSAIVVSVGFRGRHRRGDARSTNWSLTNKFRKESSCNSRVLAIVDWHSSDWRDCTYNAINTKGRVSPSFGQVTKALD
jgi:hypothetical protein